MIELYWLDDGKTILGFKFQAGFTWDDLANVMKEAQERMQQVPHRVDWIYHSASDDNEAQSIPRGNPWHMLRAASQKTPDNTGVLFIVNPGMFVKMMQRMGQSIIPNSARLMNFADTFDDAVRKIHELRAKEQSVR